MIDTHAHLICYDENGKELIERMSDDGLEVIVNIGTTVSDSELGILIAKEYENIYTTVGIYPEFAGTTTNKDLELIEKMAIDEKVVAIGEIGLDYHGEVIEKEKQKTIFIKQLEMADRLGLPFCIHCRNAAEDVYQILEQNKHLIHHGGLMHCYSEGKDWVQKFLSLGLHISFSGSITFKKNDRSFLKDIPLNRLLVETDAPYLSPEPKRGRRNEPKNVKHVIECIAKELGMEYEELKKITTENAKNFYFKIKK